jgi:hypothetical protein
LTPPPQKKKKTTLHSRLYLFVLQDTIDQLQALRQLDSRARQRRVGRTQAGGEKKHTHTHTHTHKEARERERGEMTDGLVSILARVTIGFVAFDDVASY